MGRLEGLQPDMIEIRRAHEDKPDQDSQAQGDLAVPIQERSTAPGRQRYEQQQSDREKAEKRPLCQPPVGIPAFRFGQRATALDEEGLQIQLLIDAQQEDKQGQPSPNPTELRRPGRSA